VPGDVQVPHFIGAHRAEADRLAPPIEECARREVSRDDEPIGVGIRKVSQQGRVHDGEDGGVRANTQSDGEDDDGGEGRALPQEPQRVADVVEKGVHEQ
jgi:hypothetical protein